jgi:hypothetical protein
LNVHELSDIYRIASPTIVIRNEIDRFYSEIRNKPCPGGFSLLIKDDTLPKPNYQHDKRQRELEKKKKKEEKKQRKQTTEKPEEDADPLPETAPSS